MKKTGSEIVCESLIQEGIKTVFGYPGGAVLPLYDTLSRYEKHLRHILTRHEQGAAFAAAGYARARGDIGVCIATSGPGATNLVTGIADAMADSVPLIAITGQVASHLIGTDAFQEADITGITLPITKHNYLVTDIRDMTRIMKEACYIARTGRPGPVHIDITKDVQIATTNYDYAKVRVRLPGYPIQKTVRANEISTASKLITAAKKPVIIAGHGVLLSGAMHELKEFAGKTDAALVSTLHGMSSVPFGTKNYLGMLGMHGLAAANFAIAHADLIISIGCRFDDRITGKLDDFAREAQIVHIDIDPAEIDKIIHADAPIIADAKAALAALNKKIQPHKRADWHKEIRMYNHKATTALQHARTKTTKERRLQAVEVVHAVNTVAPDAWIVPDVGQHQMWTAMNFRFNKPHRFLSSGGLGAMGFGLPTAMGAKMAHPKDSVWCLSGDGGFMMNPQELMTLAQDNINVKIAIFNNGYLGMVRQWQELFYKKNYSSTPLLNPDFQLLGKACGIKTWKVTRPSEALKITRAAENYDGPALVEYCIAFEENVFPMVPPGEALKNTRIS